MLFWADQLAHVILERKKFKYKDKIIEAQPFTVKSSASLSGVLHIGRLTDLIRGEAVFRALKENVPAKFVWVAEDMDPFRKVPAGVPSRWEDYIGVPVTDVPDPWGCHASYASHHVGDFFEVVGDFVDEMPEIFSMREEYKKGNFRPQVEALLSHEHELIEILNRYRDRKLEENFSVWNPVCDNCGKIITPRLVGREDGKILYRCEDYSFKKFTARGCGHMGSSDPICGNGKLAWKGEWAAQWVRWGVCAEGAGKEYNVPNSAWFVNGEIVERILDYPSPQPIFYEYILIGEGEKMSASEGNVVYPSDWLKVAESEALRLLFLKRIIKTRDFRWTEVPLLVDEYDELKNIYLGTKNLENEKDREHARRLYEMVRRKNDIPVDVDYGFCAVVGQITANDEEALGILESTGHMRNPTPEMKELILERVRKARFWAQHYAPERLLFRVAEHVTDDVRARLTDIQKKALSSLHARLKSSWAAGQELKGSEVSQALTEEARKAGLEPKQIYEASYLVLLGKPNGPKLAPFILALREKGLALLGEV